MASAMLCWQRAHTVLPTTPTECEGGRAPTGVRAFGGLPGAGDVEDSGMALLGREMTISSAWMKQDARASTSVREIGQPGAGWLASDRPCSGLSLSSVAGAPQMLLPTPAMTECSSTFWSVFGAPPLRRAII